MIGLMLGLLPLAGMAIAAAFDGSDKESKKAGEEGSPFTNPSPSEPAKPEFEAEQPPVITRHQLTVGGKTLDYTATVGFMPLKNEKGETDAKIFFTAYTLGAGEPDRTRPLMFSFNGGPGSSSVWLHLGALGPRRVRMLDDGAMPPPPFQLIENEFAWLEETDLVFLDPVDTGYSRARTEQLTKEFCGVDKDLDSVGEFIRLYLSRYQRWSSPLFLVGESYGTFRAAGLAGRLIEKGIAFNGIVLVSSVLNLQTLVFDEGNDIPYALYLPTYAATAWYHQRLPKELQKRKLPDLLAEVEAWSAGEYTVALAKGVALQGKERAAIAERLARYTGLSQRYVELSNLRIHISRFCKELMREEGKTVGRLDSRYTGFDAVGVTENPDFDPSLSAIRPPFTSMLNNYVRSDLGFESDAEYHILRSLDWDWGSSREGYAKSSADLSSAFAQNPYLHLFVASGYYDLATPYFATDYTFDHLALDAETRTHLQTEKYPVGHMVYLEINTLAKLKADIAAFIRRATGATPRKLSNG
jgi:carboxypeptidase C (cathepsin A)